MKNRADYVKELSVYLNDFGYGTPSECSVEAERVIPTDISEHLLTGLYSLGLVISGTRNRIRDIEDELEVTIASMLEYRGD